MHCGIARKGRCGRGARHSSVHARFHSPHSREGRVSRRMLILGFVVALTTSWIPAAAQRGADTDVVSEVRAAIASQQIPRGEEIVKQYRAARGATPEAIEALSWLARGAFAAKQLDQA